MCTALRLCLGLSLLIPSLAHAATLGIPSNGGKLSGIGVISGWKCEANGPLTVRFLDEDMRPAGNPVTLVYGSERPDVLKRGACPDANVGFVAIWNWGNLDDGTHTAVAYDNGVEFDRSTFTVATTGEDFTDANLRLRAPNFPSPGETTWFEWNQSTQHLEIAENILPLRYVCDLIPPIGNVSYDGPLLQPPPLPCEKGSQDDGDEYFIQFENPTAATEDQTCTAIRGTTLGGIQKGEIYASTRAPPHGRVRVKGEVCKNGYYIGSWTVDSVFGGIFYGAVNVSHQCPGYWQDTAGCAGEFHIFDSANIPDRYR